jgi:hypothetical protein
MLHKELGHCDFLFVTLDTLRFDVASECLSQGKTPKLASFLPNQSWEERHSPGSFTYASHQAFFAGFFPTPAAPGKHIRPLALRFAGSETTGEETYLLEGANIVEGLQQKGYRTICIGGVGFFNPKNALGRVMPSMFQESYFEPSFGVAEKDSTKNQVDFAIRRISKISTEQRVFLFVNISALHQPNYFYVEGATKDSKETHAAALMYIDGQLPRLFDFFAQRRRTAVIVCSDHGTLYGEDGYTGHRVGHPLVWTVPYAEFMLGPTL